MEQAENICLPVCPPGLCLRQEADGLTLTDGILTLRGDFEKMRKRLKTGNLQQELLVKAARIKGAAMPLQVLDATAGLGEDSLLLAAAGFHVRLYEYDPVIAALLRDALKRASQNPDLAETAARMEFFEEDSIRAMHRASFR